jgi:hypothetical protein
VVETPSSSRPAWVYKRDGRLVPFDPDKISQALFAATESLGRPNAFLARELTEGVLHFLTGGLEGAIPTTSQVADTVAKVVRELGQPALAQAFADGRKQRSGEPGGSTRKPEIVLRLSPDDPPAAVLSSCLRAYGLEAVYSRDLVAAHREGLITLTGLETPLQLSSWVLDPATHQAISANVSGTLLGAVHQAHRWTGQRLVLDGPEHALALAGPAAASAVADFSRELGLGLRSAGLDAVVNLNPALPPVWADHLAEGPLFAGRRPAPEPETLAALAEGLLEALLAGGDGGPPVRVDWHLGERDFAAPAAGRLLRLARLGLAHPGLAFAFDRPRKPVHLAEGLDRRHDAVLLTVGLHLPRLAELTGDRPDPEIFLHKLGNLARLALSAAPQKRTFLRRHHPGPQGVTRGFLLDRARLVVTPVGLEAAVRTLAGGPLCGPRAGLELARSALQQLQEVFRREGPGYQLDACLDGAGSLALEPQPAPHPWPIATTCAGLTPWDPTAVPRHQLRAAGVLHAVAGAGTAAVLIPPDRPLPAEEAAELLRFAGWHTEVVRLRFLRPAAPGRQLAAPWEAGSSESAAAGHGS